MGFLRRIRRISSGSIGPSTPTNRGTALITGVGHRVAMDRERGPTTGAIGSMSRRLLGNSAAGEVTTWCRSHLRNPGFRIGATISIVDDSRHTAATTTELPGDSKPITPRPYGEGMIPTDLVLGDRHDEQVGSWRSEPGTVEDMTETTAIRERGRITLPARDVTVRRESGFAAVVARDSVPPCTQSHFAPGATVPLLVDPENTDGVVVDHVRLAADRAPHAGAWDDPPPDSRAAQTVQRRER